MADTATTSVGSAARIEHTSAFNDVRRDAYRNRLDVGVLFTPDYGPSIPLVSRNANHGPEFHSPLISKIKDSPRVSDINVRICRHGDPTHRHKPSAVGDTQSQLWRVSWQRGPASLVHGWAPCIQPTNINLALNVHSP